MNVFKREEIKKMLDNIVGKTLGQIDTNNVFKKTINKPKITGIAGDVIEQSVFHYPQNSS